MYGGPAVLVTTPLLLRYLLPGLDESSAALQGLYTALASTIVMGAVVADMNPVCARTGVPEDNFTFMSADAATGFNATAAITDGAGVIQSDQQASQGPVQACNQLLQFEKPFAVCTENQLLTIIGDSLPIVQHWLQ